MTTEEKKDYSNVGPAIGCSNDGDPILENGIRLINLFQFLEKLIG